MEKIGCPPRTPPSRKPQIFRGFGYPRGKPLLEKIGCPPRTPPSRKPQIFGGECVIREGNRFWKKSVVPLELPFPENLRFLGRIGLSEGETAFGKNRLSPSNSPFPKTSDFWGRVRYPRWKPLLENIGYPPRTPPSRKPQIFRGFGYPRGKPLLGKNRLSPSDSPFPKISAFYYIVLSAYSSLC